MDQIHHFLHRHPLMPTEVMEEAINDIVICWGCDKGFPGPIYGCSDCKFYLHKSCAKLPEKIQNFFHACPLFLNILPYTCNACYQHGFGFSYRCKRCDFDMHVKCAQRPTIVDSVGEELFHHFTHWQHPLKRVDQKKDLEVVCNICDKLCSDSSAYGCQECNFFLHNSCMANIPQQVNHYFHPSCPLILLTYKPYRCNACDEEHHGLAFRCRKCNFQLDVKCALLPTVDSNSEGAADKIQHSGHQHPLALRENMEFFGFGCRACGENWLGGGPCFVCERSSCNFFLHRSCAVEFPQEINNNHFHPQHPLTLSALHPDPGHPTFWCRACGGVDERFMLVYRCAKCDFNLHTHCAKPKPSTPTSTPLLLKFRGHSHFLTFIDKSRGPFYCRVCWKYAQSCFFLCVTCEFAIHLYCHPSTPKTIKHKCHLHPLTLTSSPFEFELNSPEDEYNSDDEFYCDVCEQKRYKFESVYYCEDCKFIAEIRCIISEVCSVLHSHFCII